jgi:hypothetical protein
MLGSGRGLAIAMEIRTVSSLTFLLLATVGLALSGLARGSLLLGHVGGENGIWLFCCERGREISTSVLSELRR